MHELLADLSGKVDGLTNRLNRFDQQATFEPFKFDPSKIPLPNFNFEFTKLN